MSSASEARGPHLQSKSRWAIGYDEKVRQVGSNANFYRLNNRAIHTLNHVLMVQHIKKKKSPLFFRARPPDPHPIILNIQSKV